jgi:hypothetical protein
MDVSSASSMGIVAAATVGLVMEATAVMGTEEAATVETSTSGMEALRAEATVDSTVAGTETEIGGPD